MSKLRKLAYMSKNYLTIIVKINIRNNLENEKNCKLKYSPCPSFLSTVCPCWKIKPTFLEGSKHALSDKVGLKVFLEGTFMQNQIENTLFLDFLQKSSTLLSLMKRARSLQLYTQKQCCIEILCAILHI